MPTPENAMETLAEHPRYKEARRRARSLRGFYVHALAYIVVVTSVFALTAAGAPIRHWPGWPLFWGLGLLAHGFTVVVAPGLFGADWEERKIRDYLDGP